MLKSDIWNIPISFFLNILRRKNSFIFRNREHKYFIHYRSWGSERIVEIPIVLNYINFLNEHGHIINRRILEVGNVLSQFVKTNWDIVDKFEKGKDIINSDIIDYNPKEKYDLIFSISTIEHIGFNEDVGGGETPNGISDNNKISEAISNMKNILKPNGKIIVTFPLGYNKNLDKNIHNLGFSELYLLKRISRNNEWKEISKDEIINPEYNNPFPCANYICIGIINSN